LGWTKRHYITPRPSEVKPDLAKSQHAFLATALHPSTGKSVKKPLTRTPQFLYLTYRLNTVQPDSLTSTFAALADPTRRAILARLVSGGASVTKLAEPFDMSLPAISKHLKVLERAGLVARGREAQWRPCRLEAGPLKNVADWVENYRRFWEESFERLEDYLRELKCKEKKHGEKQRKH
jgi:DNA-binding transcriptional ArsR family regulator